MFLALTLLLVAGLSFLVGIYLFKGIKNKEKLMIASSSIAFVVILGLIVFDLAPELLEMKKWYFIIFIILGLVILSILDLFVPHHHHEHHEHDEKTLDHQNHLIHISIVTIIALMLHNLVEGAALYGITISSAKSGILMCIAITLHNIPLGLQISNYAINKKSHLLIVLLVLSALVGGLLVLLFGGISEIILGIITSLTLGMLLHLLIFELFGEIINNRHHIENYYGIIIGIILMIVINLL